VPLAQDAAGGQPRTRVPQCSLHRRAAPAQQVGCQEEGGLLQLTDGLAVCLLLPTCIARQGPYMHGVLV
jgi:hypothetical protein